MGAIARMSAGVLAGVGGPAWVAARRWGWMRRARGLTSEEVGAFEGYFSVALLRRVRVAEVERIELWAPFGGIGRRLARRGGVVGSPAGLALDDLVVVATGAGAKVDRASLLFHEMVHVVQWAVLGRAQFLREYVGSWAAAGWSYWGIPLEAMAYEMQGRFDAGERFDAEREVRRRLAG